MDTARLSVVCFGQQNWDYCWTGKQQLLSRLAARGHRVLYVDPEWAGAAGASASAWAALHPGRSRAGLVQEGPGELFVYRYAPVRGLGWRLNRRHRPRALARVASALGFTGGVALALRPPALDLVPVVRPRGLLYYAVDEMTAFGERSAEERRAVRAAEDRMLRAADVALAVSERLHRRFLTVQPRAYYLPNGADVEHFAPDALAAAPPLADLPPTQGPVLGFVGQVDERLDQELVAAMARARPDWTVLLAGRVKPGVDVATLAGLPNVHLLGYRDYADLPSVLQRFDVCLVPYRRTELTRSCNPLKVFEYLATGRPVVATDLDGLQWCRHAIEIAGQGTDAFVTAVERALAGTQEDRRQRIALARANGWDDRVDALEDHLRTLADRRPPKRTSPHRGAPVASRTPAALPGEPQARWGARGEAVFQVARGVGALQHVGRRLARTLRGHPHPDVGAILVAQHARLGDVLAMLPLLAALRQRYPAARVDLGTPSGSVALGAVLRDLGLVDEVVALGAGSRGRARHLLGLWRRGWDLSLTGYGTGFVREALWVGAVRRWGLDDGTPEHRHLTRRVPVDPGRHQAENHLLLLGPGEDVVGSARIPTLPVADGETDRRSVVLHVGAQKPSRRWPAERFVELVEALGVTRPELRFVFTGAPDEAPLVERVLETLTAEVRARADNRAGATDLEGLARLLAGAGAVVSNDTGVLHLARAVGAPLVAVLGPENADLWGPHPGGRAPVVALRAEVPCAPCKLWSCDPLYCLRSVSADAVVQAVLDLLDRAHPVWLPGDEGVEPGTEPVLHGVHRRFLDRDWDALARAGFAVPVDTPDPRHAASRSAPASSARNEGRNTSVGRNASA